MNTVRDPPECILVTLTDFLGPPQLQLQVALNDLRINIWKKLVLKYAFN